MAHASDRNDPRTVPTGVREHCAAFMTGFAARLGAARTSLRKVEVAQSARCNLASFSAREVQDTGTDPSDATGIAAWQTDLPFFMQNGFGRR